MNEAKIIIGIMLVGLLLLTSCTTKDDTDWDKLESDYGCKVKNKVVVFNTLNEHNCSSIKAMLDSEYFPNVVVKYNTTSCNGNVSFGFQTTDTHECYDCAERKWRKEFFERCS